MPPARPKKEMLTALLRAGARAGALVAWLGVGGQGNAWACVHCSEQDLEDAIDNVDPAEDEQDGIRPDGAPRRALDREETGLVRHPEGALGPSWQVSHECHAQVLIEPLKALLGDTMATATVISLESFPPRGGSIHPAHLLGERLLANELDNLEKRYAKLVKMMRRLAFMVERDSPATFREFMGKPEPMSLKEQDEARQADLQMLAPTLPPPPAAGFELLASRPSYDASARHEGIIFGGPLGGGPLRVDKVDGVHLWDLCGGCALAYVEGDTPAPKLGREYTVAVWVLWRPGAAEDEARALLCGEGGDDWLVAVGEDLGSATGRGDDLGFEPFVDSVGLEASVGGGGEGWQLVVVTGRGATDGARSGESTLWVGTSARPPAVAGRAKRVWCGERLSSIGRPAERAGWVGAVMVWGRALPEPELASLHAASRRPYAMAGQHRASGGDGGAGSSATAAAAAAMRAREREWAAKREKAAEEAKAREARREAQQAVVRRHAAEAKEMRGQAEGARQQQAEEATRDRERMQAQREHARMAAALRKGEQADAAREAREARWSEAARRRIDADRQKLEQAAQLAAAASLIQRRQRERKSAREAWRVARETTAREGGARRRDDVAARQAARDKELKERAAARIQRQRSAQARGAGAARELTARRKKAADATRAELAMHESDAAALRRERQLEAALRIQHDQRQRAERAAEREADAAAQRRRQLAENARRKKELARARELDRGGIGSAGRQLTAPPPAPLRLRNEDGVVYKVI